jgi:hypothetical protein
VIYFAQGGYKPDLLVASPDPYFIQGDVIAWSAPLLEPVGAMEVTWILSIESEDGSSEHVVDSEQQPLSSPDTALLADTWDTSLHHLDPGIYDMAYYRDTTKLAHGWFELLPLLVTPQPLDPSHPIIYLEAAPATARANAPISIGDDWCTTRQGTYAGTRDPTTGFGLTVDGRQTSIDTYVRDNYNAFGGQPCLADKWFVYELPDGLPAGIHSFQVDWQWEGKPSGAPLIVSIDFE